MDSIGRFIAYELGTTDVAGSRGFYREVFGWTVDERLRLAGGGPQWCRLAAAERSGWLGFLTIPDLVDAIELASSLGATTVVPAREDPQFGPIAVLRDPDGARFGLVQPQVDPEELEPQPRPGVIAWNVLISHDPERSLGFYMRVFGWSATRHELPEIGTYLVCEREGLATAGFVRARADAGVRPEGEWLSAIAVSDVEAATASALGLGATPRWQPTTIPTIGRFSVVIDPTGARVAMLEIDAAEEFG